MHTCFSSWNYWFDPILLSLISTTAAASSLFACIYCTKGLWRHISECVTSKQRRGWQARSHTNYHNTKYLCECCIYAGMREERERGHRSEITFDAGVSFEALGQTELCIRPVIIVIQHTTLIRALSTHSHSHTSHYLFNSLFTACSPSLSAALLFSQVLLCCWRALQFWAYYKRFVPRVLTRNNNTHNQPALLLMRPKWFRCRLKPRWYKGLFWSERALSAASCVLIMILAG